MAELTFTFSPSSTAGSTTCDLCGALVSSVETHIEWHRTLDEQVEARNSDERTILIDEPSRLLERVRAEVSAT